jgi:hypothetical protein
MTARLNMDWKYVILHMHLNCAISLSDSLHKFKNESIFRWLRTIHHGDILSRSSLINYLLLSVLEGIA